MSDRTNRFEVGATYQTRSIGDHNCTVAVTIASRTKCFVRTTEGKRLKVQSMTHYSFPCGTDDTGSLVKSVEHVKPWGSYSMAPSIGADQRID